jgi:hypothetical protein
VREKENILNVISMNSGLEKVNSMTVPRNTHSPTLAPF